MQRAGRRVPSVGRGLAVAATYAVACAVMLAPIANFRHFESASYGSDTRLMIWVLAWVDHAILDGAPLFDANIFHPAPNTLAYSEHALGIGIFTLPIYAFTRNPTLGYNLAWLLSYFLCALAAHALAYRATRDHLAAAVAGLAYAFCFFRMLHGHAHLQLLWAFWIPLSLIALDAWWRTPSWPRLLLLVLVVLLQVLASWYLAVLVLVANLALLLWLAATAPPARALRPRLALQLGAGAMAGAAVVWPIARRYLFLIGETGGPAEALAASARWSDYIVPPLNTWLGQWMAAQGSPAPQWIWGENTLFVGYVTLILAAIGAAAAWSAPRKDAPGDPRWFVLLAALALALAAGPDRGAVTANGFDWTPFGLFSALPGMSLFRVPARFALLLTLALAVLAAFGAFEIHRLWGRAGRIATLLLIPVMLAEWRIVDFPGGPPQPDAIPAVYRDVAGRQARAVVSLPDYSGTAEWFYESDYQFYSTAHWRPIVNGYSRIEPPGHRDRLTAIARFPEPESAAMLRQLGVDYVVVHTRRFPDGGVKIVEAAKSSAEFELAAQHDADYLYRVRPR